MAPKPQQACDLRAEDEEGDPAAFAEGLVHCLLRKGFCVLAGSSAPEALREALREVRQLESDGRFEKPPDEIVEGLLGAEGSGRLAPLLEAGRWPDVEEEEGEAEGAGGRGGGQLRALDGHMYGFGASLGSLSPFYLGFELQARDQGFLLEAGSPSVEAPPPLTAEVCCRWLDTFDVHRIMCLFLLGPAGGTLEMRPFDGVSGSHSVRLEPGTWVLLRADMLSHTFTPTGTGYVLSCFYFQNQSDAEPRRKQRDFPRVPVAAKLDAWLLDTVKTLKETTGNEEELEAMTSRAIQRMTNQMYHKGAQVAVRGQACRFPAASANIDFYRCLLFTGSDAGEVIPHMRWDNDLYYVEENAENLVAMANQVGFSPLRHRYNCEHGSFIEGLELFDNKFFGLSLMETKGMDPNQRHLLETCYEVTFSAGMRKPNLMKAHIGVYTAGPGTMEAEWGAVPKEFEGGALASTSGSSAILSNRLSYTFGMNGPNFLLNADAASSLIACSLGCDALQRTKAQCEAALVLGIDTILHPFSYSQFCWAGLMSRRGRCLAFDETADGYIRGEGCGGLYMNSFLHEIDGEVVVDEEPRVIGLCCGAWASHCGQVASLTAPSGANDQELLGSALRAAEISALDVDAVDAHGGATLLNDAVEAQALCRAYRGRGKSRDEPEILHLGCAKATFGNGKPVAGMYALIKVLISQELGYMAPSNHLLRLNPHIMLEDFPVGFATEYIAQRMNSAFTGITAKGFGGSCAHVILWGAVNFDRVSLPTPVLNQREIAYWPGGGGDLDEEAKPNRSYMIVGSWSGWSKPEPMKAEGRGVYAHTVALGDLGFESFQIWLDGDSRRVLHPGMPGAIKDVPVKGPNPAEETGDSYWTIAGPAVRGALQLGDGGRAVLAKAVEEEVPGEVAPRGGQYHVQLLINGRYRMVTWSEVAEDQTAALTNK